MAAPLGFKTFVTGDVLTAADTNGYLMQGVWTFANAAARDAAVTSPQEGNVCYLKDTDAVMTYSGAAWVAVGGSGGWTLASTTALSTASTSLTIPTGYKQVKIWVENYQITGNAYATWRLNSVTTSTYRENLTRLYGTSTSNLQGQTVTAFSMGIGGQITTGNNKNMMLITLEDYENTTSYKLLQTSSIEQDVAGFENALTLGQFAWLNTTAITSLQLLAGASTWAGGTAYVYGVK